MAQQASNEELVTSMMSSFDDLMHLSTEKLTTSGSFNCSLGKSQYGQVVFHDLCDVYPTDSDIKCRYSLTDNVHPQPGDKIALFKVGWVSVSEYVTYERALLPEVGHNLPLQVIFPADSLPKDERDLYQLCYVTSGNVIAGASVPFSFRKLHESELIAVEDPKDPGLIVFKSRVSQLQEDLSKTVEEKDSLLDKNCSLASALENLKMQLTNSLSEKEKVVKELEELKNKKCEEKSEDKNIEENSLREENSVLTLTLEQTKLELSKALQEKENISTELEELRHKLEEKVNENEVLQKQMLGLSEELKSVSLINKASFLENDEYNGQLIDKQKEIDSLKLVIGGLQNTNEMCKNLQKTNSILKNDKDEMEKKLKQCVENYNRMVSENLKLNEELVIKMSISEENKVLKEKIMKLEEEKSRLLEKHAREKQELREKLKSRRKNPQNAFWTAVRTSFDDFMTDPGDDNIPEPVKYENVKRSKEHSRKCDSHSKDGNDKLELDRLKSRVSSLIQERADVRSELVQFRHENESLMKDLKLKREENAELKSRVGVQEFELKFLKKSMKDDFSGPQLACFDDFNFKECMDRFVSSIPVVEKFNSLVLEKSAMLEQLEEEKCYKLQLHKKIEHLLLKESEAINELESLRNNNQKLLQDSQKLETLTKEKEILENKLVDLRKELVGKISVDYRRLRKDCKDLSEDCCSQIKTQLQKTGIKFTKLCEILSEICPIAMEELGAANDNLDDFTSRNNILCPLCNCSFPPGCGNEFISHIECHWLETHCQN